MDSGLSHVGSPGILEMNMENENKEDVLMEEIKKYWQRGVRFSCGERLLEEFSLAQALAEDERYMIELDINTMGEVEKVNFQDISM